jgi:hypothetical protein
MWIMLMSNFDLTLSIVLGILLAAATCFRVFLPMLIASAAAYAGHLPLDDNFAWLATPAVLIMLSVAALVEIIAYYIPGIDNLLDIMAAPAGLVAGTVLSAAVMTDLPSILKWTAAIVAGGGAAGLTQNLTTMLRAKSTVFTGGVGNSVTATAELGGVFLIPLLALAAPLIAFALALVCFGWRSICFGGCANPGHTRSHIVTKRKRFPKHRIMSSRSHVACAVGRCRAGASSVLRLHRGARASAIQGMEHANVRPPLTYKSRMPDAGQLATRPSDAIRATSSP